VIFKILLKINFSDYLVFFILKIRIIIYIFTKFYDLFEVRKKALCDPDI